MNSYYTGKFLSYPVTEQVKDFVPILFLALLMGIGVYLVKYIHLRSNIVLLLSQVSIGVALYIILCSFAKYSYFMEIRSIAQEEYLSLRHRINNL